MKLDREQVRKIAHLARLGLSEEEIEHYARDMSRILDYIHKISEVDVAGVEPLAHPAHQRTRLREDQTRPCLDRDEALSQAPDAAHGLFRVRAVLPTQESASRNRPDDDIAGATSGEEN